MERGNARRSSFKRTREGHRQSDEHWNCFKGKDGESAERRGVAHNYGGLGGGGGRKGTILYGMELN